MKLNDEVIKSAARNSEISRVVAVYIIESKVLRNSVQYISISTNDSEG